MINRRKSVNSKLWLFIMFLMIFVIVTGFSYESRSQNASQPIPASLIVDFETRYATSKTYQLIDTVEFSLNSENSTQIYKGKNDGHDLIFSFVGVNFPISVFVMTDENTEMLGVGFIGDTGIFAKMSAHNEYSLKYTLGVNDSSVYYPLKGKTNY